MISPFAYSFQTNLQTFEEAIEVHGKHLYTNRKIEEDGEEIVEVEYETDDTYRGRPAPNQIKVVYRKNQVGIRVEVQNTAHPLKIYASVVFFFFGLVFLGLSPVFTILLWGFSFINLTNFWKHKRFVRERFKNHIVKKPVFR